MNKWLNGRSNDFGKFFITEEEEKKKNWKHEGVFFFCPSNVMNILGHISPNQRPHIFCFLFKALYCLETGVNCVANCVMQKFPPWCTNCRLYPNFNSDKSHNFCLFHFLSFQKHRPLVCFLKTNQGYTFWKPTRDKESLDRCG